MTGKDSSITRKWMTYLASKCNCSRIFTKLKRLRKFVIRNCCSKKRPRQWIGELSKGKNYFFCYFISVLLEFGIHFARFFRNCCVPCRKLHQFCTLLNIGKLCFKIQRGNGGFCDQERSPGDPYGAEECSVSWQASSKSQGVPHLHQRSVWGNGGGRGGEVIRGQTFNSVFTYVTILPTKLTSRRHN